MNKHRVTAAIIGGGLAVFAAATIAAIMNDSDSLSLSDDDEDSPIIMHRIDGENGLNSHYDADESASDEEPQNLLIQDILPLDPAKSPESELYTTRIFVRALSPSFVIEIDGEKDHAIVSVELLRAVVPNSQNTVTSRNNMLEIIVHETKYTICIPTGNYNVASLFETIQTLVRDKVGRLCCKFEVEYIASSGKTKIKNGNVPFKIAFPDTNSIAYELGFASGGDAYKSELTPCGEYIVSPYRCDISGPRYLYVVSDELAHPGMHPSGVLAEIPLINSHLQYTDFSCDTMRRREFGQAIRLQHLHCRLMQPTNRRSASAVSDESDAAVSKDQLSLYDTCGLICALTIEVTRIRPKHPLIHSAQNISAR